MYYKKDEKRLIRGIPTQKLKFNPKFFKDSKIYFDVKKNIIFNYMSENTKNKYIHFFTYYKMQLYKIPIKKVKIWMVRLFMFVAKDTINKLRNNED